MTHIETAAESIRDFCDHVNASFTSPLPTYSAMLEELKYSKQLLIAAIRATQFEMYRKDAELKMKAKGSKP